MNPLVLATDTHPLVWYLSEDHSKLSGRARKAFAQAVEGSLALWIPAAVLWEFSLILKSGKVRPRKTLEEFVANGFYAKSIHLADLTPEDVVLAHSLNFTVDPYDTLIVASALRLDCPLITKDAVIHRHKPCELFWD